MSFGKRQSSFTELPFPPPAPSPSCGPSAPGTARLGALQPPLGGTQHPDQPARGPVRANSNPGKLLEMALTPWPLPLDTGATPESL